MNEARQYFYKKNADALAAGKPLAPVTNYKGEYGSLHQGHQVRFPVNLPNQHTRRLVVVEESYDPARETCTVGRDWGQIAICFADSE